MKTPASGVRIGLAGWSEAVSRHRASLPPAARSATDAPALSRYATAFDFVEVNNSFYRQVRPATYAQWAAEVPDDFRFAVKMHRLITHYTRLKNTALLEPFFQSVDGLGDKLAAVLVQLPPTLVFDPAVASEFFAALRTLYAGAVVCEPRHASWSDQAALDLLESRDIGLVRTEIPEPAKEKIRAGVPIYVRLHGSPRRYYSAYSAEQLGQLAEFLRLNAKRARFVVFDNTASTAAIRNALELRQLLGLGDEP